MSVDALIARMTQDAHARIAALRAHADAELAALADAGAQASSRDNEQWLAAREATRQAGFTVERASAQRRAAATLLRAQHALLDRVLARALSLCDQAGDDARYVDSLPGQMAAVAGYLGGRSATLRCRPALAARLRSWLAERPQLSLAEDDTVAAGFVVDADDGSCTVDGTLAARLSALWPQLEAGLLAQVPQ
jgi:vacuolar-type H+-ATPase subunit E/Vma4